jgi:glucose-6-phosphate 1-dehydrogenase
MVSVKRLLVVAGASGDLFAIKVAPALLRLHREGKLDGVEILGTSRKDWSNLDFQRHVLEVLTKASLEPTEEFLARFAFAKSDISDPGSVDLLIGKLVDAHATGVSSVALYLAIAPELFTPAFDAIARAVAQRAPQAREWLRVVVEKPYGSDSASAQALDEIILPALGEDGLYRIDHYLSKETLQDVLALRFANRLFEAAWTAPNISEIRIRAYETATVGTRGAFYDGVGAIRDVAQNHLLQMIAAVTMDEPETFDAQTVRTRRAEALERLEYKAETGVIAQYVGYTDTEKVAADSTTETAFSFKLGINAPRWNGVPIDVRGGKGFNKKETYIEIEFQPSTVSFSRFEGAPGHNRIRIELFPSERVTFTMFGKEPGIGARITPREFGYSIQDADAPAVGDIAYAATLHSAIVGDTAQFVGSREVAASWKLTDFLRADARSRPGRSYSIGSDPDSVLG